MRKLLNLSVKNVAAVDRPANRRSFLVIKAADAVPLTFDDAMFGQRLHKVYCALSDRYTALMDVFYSLNEAPAEGKLDAYKKAVTDFATAVAADVPKLIAGLDEEQKSALDMTPCVKLRDSLTAMIEGVEMSEKKTMDASALAKMGNAIAALFGRAAGADESVITELEKGGEKDPNEAAIAAAVSASVKVELEKAAVEKAALEARLAKAEAATAALQEQTELRKFADEVMGYKDIGLDPTKDAALLKAVSEKLPAEMSERVREILKAQLAQAKTAQLFKEVGSSGPGMLVAGSADEMIQQRIDAIVAKNDKVSWDDARKQVFKEDPSLYERHRKENAVRV